MKTLQTATFALLLFAGCLCAGSPPVCATSSFDAPSEAAPPRVAHVTIVMMENKDYDWVVGSPHAPYFNTTLVPQGALMRNSHAVAHPSEPNYLALFSGSTQGIHGDPCPAYFSAPTVATRLAAAGLTFGGYSESMPRNGYVGCHTARYDRNHNPWVEFRNIPAADNLVYLGFPRAPQSLVWIAPNLCHDTHNCSVKAGDDWLARSLPPIIAWDRRNDGLLVLTWDEADPDKSGTNHIPTVLVGPMVRSGVKSDQSVDHYALLHTIETMFGVPCIENECGVPILRGIWQ
jgi:phosphatidylinositol-3-phosphatase